MRTRRCRVKPIGEILRFVSHQPVAELHDTHRVRWHAVISKYKFSDPEIAAADNSPDRKTLLVRLDESALLNALPAADPLARLRIIKHRVLVVDFMLDLEIACVRSIPMALQRHPHASIIHVDLHLRFSERGCAELPKWLRASHSAPLRRPIAAARSRTRTASPSATARRMRQPTTAGSIFLLDGDGSADGTRGRDPAMESAQVRVKDDAVSDFD